MYVVRNNGFIDQVKKVIEEAATNFHSFSNDRRSIVDAVGHYFRSNNEIEGTSDNGVLRTADGWMYTANIIVSAPMEQARMVCNEWNSRLTELTESGFEQEVIQMTESTPHDIYGWRYIGKEMMVVLELWPLSGDDDQGTLNLAFFNWL